ncbi:intradiol ring-cleavage dioxygenase [Brachybacterium sp. MASK1Z-5]|uniref:Intradiol ring-cleavage dioxygenase n=1 Tax=Brachybacterium halotolerans TaxID=2795215 RepID=A0ABS1B7K6_9MICO|nr:intradiol ring-cleavage dioxygenase [Brachybacterium halotolerans]
MHLEADGTPTYEGRPLEHPEEPLADQGLGFDLRTLLSRRRTLAGLGLGAAAMGLAACGSSSADSTTESSSSSDSGGDSTSDGEIPEETNGPYPADGTNGVNVLTESGIIRADITSSFGDASATASGVPIELTLNITNLNDDNSAYEGVAVYVWQCDAAGEYSLYSEGLEDENYLRGVQVADAQGSVTFTSIFPGCYMGRWPHIHFEVYPDADSITSTDNLLATSQVALPQDVCETVYALDEYDGSAENMSKVTLDSDNVFGEDGGELQLAEVEGDAESGYTVTLPVAIDPTTEPGVSDDMGGGSAPSDGGGGTPPSDGGGTPPGGSTPSGQPGGGAQSDGGGSQDSASASTGSAESSLVGNVLAASR